MPKKIIFLAILVLLSMKSFSQTDKRILRTKFTDDKITIDAKFDEKAWQEAEIATNFLMVDPDNGKPEELQRKTEVKIVFNNDAIYVAAKLYDAEPNKIAKELTIRDNFASSDHFGAVINGYNDGQQDFRFFVSASGVQIDIVYTESNGEDYSWNAIWDSKVAITDYGWAAEMKIPYAALRFTSEEKQTWGLNFYREVNNLRQSFTWNLISNKISNEAVQHGILEGIENIKTPTRLFFIPYVSQYFSASDAVKTKGEFKGGMDIKYGINDSFTLDAILVPDFGQAAFDNVVLNLGPFEQQFNENRPFFTESTELFNKGGLFYSRRIGGDPSIYPELNTDEEFVENPAKVNLLNALKVSGRTKSGLGVGVLNAVTEKTEATIKNVVSGNIRNVVTEPLANYNVLVLDQRFHKNSSVSLINTNVFRNGEFRDSNVTAGVFDLNTKSNSYNLSGNLKYSATNEFGDNKDKNGIESNINFSKTSGKWRFNMGNQYISKNYDNNDLGINFQTHYNGTYTNISYRILNPTKTFNSFSIFNNNYVEFDNTTGKIQASNTNFNVNSTSKKNDYYGAGFNYRLLDVYDFYEPRTEDQSRYVILPKRVGGNFFISTNYARKFAIDFGPSINFFNEKNRYSYNIYLSPRYRFSNKLSLIMDSNFDYSKNNTGYYGDDGTNIYFTRRNVTQLTNSVTTKYTINNVMNINLSVRHYWSFVINKEYLFLQTDGKFLDTIATTVLNNRNLALWNLDLSYSWWFAPGSQISMLYRNNAVRFQRENIIDENYLNNLKDNLRDAQLNHTLSINIRYFVDYNSLKRKK